MPGMLIIPGSVLIQVAGYALGGKGVAGATDGLLDKKYAQDGADSVQESLEVSV